MWASQYTEPETQKITPHIRVFLQLPRMSPATDFDELEAIAAATAGKLAAAIAQHSLQNHHVVLRLLVGQPGELCQMRNWCLRKAALSAPKGMRVRDNSSFISDGTAHIAV